LQVVDAVTVEELEASLLHDQHHPLWRRLWRH